ncbi:hypothetical protein GQ53DRAFT_872618 [Thozetella sp. PMI_491]|nr:hypothetical protein GQ53DRAFT_872618 [Thozetella sp. PMI_491]
MSMNAFTAGGRARLAAVVGLGLITAAHGYLGREVDGEIGHPGEGGGGDGFHGWRTGPGLDMSTAINYRTAHGILAAVAISVLFPFGSILMRVIPGRAAVYVHAVFQTLTLCIFIAGAALGIHLVRNVNIAPNGEVSSMMSHPMMKIHPTLGIVSLATLLPQPLLGYLHHRKFKQTQARSFWTYMHLINGRIAVTVSVADGYFGLKLAQAPEAARKAYIAVAAIFWGSWAVIAIYSELRRMKENRRTARAVKRRLSQGAQTLKPQPSSESSEK